jgi:hypothetical protein
VFPPAVYCYVSVLILLHVSSYCNTQVDVVFPPAEQQVPAPASDHAASHRTPPHPPPHTPVSLYAEAFFVVANIRCLSPLIEP